MTTAIGLEEGLHLRVPSEVYHQRISGLISKGALDHVHRSLAHYKAWLSGAKDETSEALDFGGAFHCALLEPQRFESDYVVEPTFAEFRDARGALSTKAGKAAKAEWLESIKDHGRTVLDTDHRGPIAEMVAAVRRHPLASRMLSEGEPEATAIWKDPDTGLMAKCRADYYVRRRRMVVDIKTTTDASADAFRRSIARYRYHVQDALYRAGFGAVGETIEHFVFVAVEKAPPYAVAVYSLDSEGIQRGYAHAVDDISRLAEGVRNDDFPGYPATIQVLELPSWAA